MSRKRPDPPLYPIEQDFIDALVRLQANQPKHPTLVRRTARSRGRRVKINISTVAMEAGHSRTLIGTDTCCEYPRVRAKILAAMKQRPLKPVATADDVIKRLRETNAALDAQVLQWASYSAALLRRLRQVEMGAGREVSRAKRATQRQLTAANRVAGASVDSAPGGVIPFPSGPDKA